ncbi:hypothetical protein OGH69_13550 [Flavobacterium sp. MFBS3-15]|uniref:hypothetical protein n=1 Tax=Flavobacterium sp. MFBS3-15 TaxID=2989816 RepID=UPI0022369C2B|nr:hypothetical protein [Flavobacterium sp. MFBS3-15]MCW4469998.1 hypothetical protein [Flavobacterium sp. MFBS3-15]
MKKVLALLLMILVTGCIDHKAQVPPLKEIPKASNAFQNFLAQFPGLSFPIQVKACGEMPDLEILDGAASYPYNRRPDYIFGKFSLNDGCVAVITFSTADCMLPILTTYHPDGIEIDSKPLAVGQCSDGPCYKCEEVLQIGKDLTIRVADTMQTFECDEDDLPKGAPITTTIVYKEGKITPSGRIEISKEKEKQL